MANGGTRVVSILYKEIVAGDLRKILATSNDSDSGGGARDFRFGSFNLLLPIIRRMFPDTVQEKRKRKGKTVYIDTYKGQFSWRDNIGNLQTKESYFETPTDVRPREGRIPRVHEYECFDLSLVPKNSGGKPNRLLILLIQLEDGSVWPFYAEEVSLKRQGEWDPMVAKELIRCLDSVRPQKSAVIGYRDFTNTDRYCNGK